MAEFAAEQDMDAFLINPTARKKDTSYLNSPSQNASGDLIPIFLSDEIMTVKAGKKAVRPLGVISKFADESLFSYGYASEEEAASPVDDTDFGFHSTSDTESTSSIREALSVEDLTDHAYATQLCTKAQAVQFVSAGKAKVVSVPKLVATPSTRRSIEPVDSTTSFPNFSKPISNVPRTSDVQNRSPRCSSERSQASNSFAEQRTIRRKPRLPPLLAAPPTTSPRTTRTQTPLADQRADFVKADPYESNSPPNSASPSKLKMPKLSPSFRLKPFSRSRRSDSSASNSSDTSDGRLDWWTLAPSPTTPACPNTRSVSRTSSKPTAKLVPRGASERAPPIVLPDCPADYNEDWEVDDSPSWPLRKDSIPSFEVSSTLQHIRRKSISAVYVTTQV